MVSLGGSAADRNEQRFNSHGCVEPLQRLAARQSAEVWQSWIGRIGIHSRNLQLCAKRMRAISAILLWKRESYARTACERAVFKLRYDAAILCGGGQHEHAHTDLQQRDAE